MSNGVTFVSFINGHQPWLSRLDDPRSVRANVYVNQNVLQVVSGSRLTYSILTQDTIAGIGFPYVRRFKSEFRRSTSRFFRLGEQEDDHLYRPPEEHRLIGEPEGISSNVFSCWVRPFRGKGAILYPNALVDFYQRAISNTSWREWNSSDAKSTHSAPQLTQTASSTVHGPTSSHPSSQLDTSLPSPPKSSSNDLSEEDVSSSTDDLVAPIRTKNDGFRALISHLNQRVERLEGFEQAYQECSVELRAAHHENARLSDLLQAQEDYVHDLVSAMEAMSATNAALEATVAANAEVDYSPYSTLESLPTAQLQQSPGQSLLLPTYDEVEASQLEPGPSQMRGEPFSFAPTFMDGVVQPFRVPHQLFGEHVQDAIERLHLSRAEDIHELCFTIQDTVPTNMWQARLQGCRFIQLHAAELLDAMERDIRARASF